MTLEQRIRHARRLIEEFVWADPSLWPILSEIDLALTFVGVDIVSAAKTQHSVHTGGGSARDL
jgi:hypothetical protein